ncbi:MAG: hypothetical protein RLZZ01_1498 [Actinomycetota bacterium]
MARSSSTSKAAKLAQKRSGRTVRFQGGTVFPLAVAIVLVVGLGLIVYGRQTLPSADASPPTIDDHWHAAYGFNICGEWYQLAGDLEDRNSQGQYVYTNFLRTGIHSHDDGVMHWHPNTSRAVGKNAVLGVFLESYEVELTDDSLTFPAENILGFSDEYIEGETQCDGEDASLSVRAWDLFTDTDSGNRFITKMDQVRLTQDNMVFAVYFGPDDMDQTMPPWAEQLPQLGAIDSGQVLPADLLQSDPTGSSVPADSAPASTIEDSGSGADE